MVDFLDLYCMKQHRILYLFVLSTLVFSCSTQKQSITANEAYQFKALNNGKPDYSDLHYWAAHPYKKDPSDSVPKPLLSNYQKDSAVDIFFVHPTTYTDASKIIGWNALIDDATINAKTDYSPILFQASVFNAAGRIFAPRYRQAHLSAYYAKTAQDSSDAIAAFELAYQDIKAAFEYYLAHNNAGRPIIIASHSQGSTHTKRLLKEFFENKPLYSKLVAAYIIGMPVPINFYTAIPSCNLPNQTGCICSWRTYKQGYIPEDITQEKNKAIVTNPLSWDATKTNMDRNDNKGGILLKFNSLVTNVASATISDGVLWTVKPHFFGNIFYTTKNYHIADYNLYYLSIRENAQTRINAYLKK